MGLYTRRQLHIEMTFPTLPEMSKNEGASPGRKCKPSLDRRQENVIAGPYKIIVGVDEAGRGPLCGPVVAAACLIPNHDDLVLHGIMDSKKLTDEKERDEIYECLISDARVMWCTSVVSNHEIDSINILQASLAAMKRATIGLLEKYKISDTSTYVALIDGNKTPVEMPMASKCVIKVY
jgi:ribonuclease HII